MYCMISFRCAVTRLVEESPLIAHDFGELRKTALKQIASPHGEDHKVDEAVEVQKLKGILNCEPLIPFCCCIALSGVWKPSK